MDRSASVASPSKKVSARLYERFMPRKAYTLINESSIGPAKSSAMMVKSQENFLNSSSGLKSPKLVTYRAPNGSQVLALHPSLVCSTETRNPHSHRIIYQTQQCSAHASPAVPPRNNSRLTYVSPAMQSAMVSRAVITSPNTPVSVRHKSSRDIYEASYPTRVQ
ncbi:hypothetical protein Ciccas_002947 [Cichlidogyrus casuarinus]|uniref:Uncharacterized protein n=1 Tax=Cichlidogyrus casuarinus TaxID=1844966 RepID=A0ABD2QFV5_9PLAT